MTPMMVFALLGVAVAVYALTAGADFGGGVWDLLASGPRRERQRELIADAIAPIWEVNHICMIFVVVVLFTVFPIAFAVVSTALHVPLTLVLVGIVRRGAGDGRAPAAAGLARRAGRGHTGGVALAAVGVAGGSVLFAPALWWLFRVFEKLE